MPMRSKAQSRLMHAAAHDPAAAKRMGVPQDVAEEFVQSSHGKSLRGLPEHIKKNTGGVVSGYPKKFKW